MRIPRNNFQQNVVLLVKIVPLLFTNDINLIAQAYKIKVIVFRSPERCEVEPWALVLAFVLAFVFRHSCYRHFISSRAFLARALTASRLFFPAK